MRVKQTTQRRGSQHQGSNPNLVSKKKNGSSASGHQDFGPQTMSYTTHLHRAGTTQSRLGFLSLLPVYPCICVVVNPKFFLIIVGSIRLPTDWEKSKFWPVLTHTTVITMPIILLSPFLLTKSIEITMFVWNSIRDGWCPHFLTNPYSLFQ